MGTYNAVYNVMLINDGVLDEEIRKEYGADFVEGDKIASTMIQELTHLKDPWEYKSNGKEITKENHNAYIAKLNKRAKKLLDSAGITADNVGEISEYAKVSYDHKEYDEVYTEYCVKQKFGR